MGTWEDAINVFKIEESIIPNREPVQTQGATGRWTAY